MPKTNDIQTVRVPCDVDGYDNFWVDVDVGSWGYAEYLEILMTALPLVVIRYFEQYSTDWYVEAEDGTVIVHPGRAASHETWLSVYRSLGVQRSRELGEWFGKAIVMASSQSLELGKKSAGPSGGDGEGSEDSPG